MVDHNLTAEQEQFAESHSPYGRIAWVVVALTAVEYLFASFVPVPFGTLVSGLMLLSVVKVSLVGWYFMHLKFMSRWVYLMLVPAAVLSVVVVGGLVPDVVFAHRSEEAIPQIHAQ